MRKKEKEENIGDNLRGDSDEVLEANLRKFDEKFNEMVRGGSGVDHREGKGSSPMFVARAE